MAHFSLPPAPALLPRPSPAYLELPLTNAIFYQGEILSRYSKAAGYFVLPRYCTSSTYNQRSVPRKQEKCLFNGPRKARCEEVCHRSPKQTPFFQKTAWAGGSGSSRSFVFIYIFLISKKCPGQRISCFCQKHRSPIVFHGYLRFLSGQNRTD